MHIPASHILLRVDLNSARKSAVCQAIGCRKAIVGLCCFGTSSSEEPTPSQVGWNMLIAQVPNLLTERNSGEAEPLQHSFLPSPMLLSVSSGSDSGTGFHSLIISSRPRRISQASQSFVSACPGKAMQNQSTTGTVLCNTPDSGALLEESCTTGAGSGRGGAGCPCKRAECQQTPSHQGVEGKG